MSVFRPTRRELVRRRVAALALLIGVPGSFWAATGLMAAARGDGWAPVRVHLHLLEQLHVLHPEQTAPPLAQVDRLPDRPVLAAVLAAVLLLVWIVAVVRPLLAGSGHDPRARALASWPQLSRLVSARAARKAGRFTRPGTGWWWRATAPISEFGYHLGRVRGTRHDVHANFEQRVRIIARTGWGKTSRLLVPAARALPGAALIGTTAADLFEQTVTARAARGEVAVVDFSDARHRYAAGFTRLRWNPVRGCRDLSAAHRRAAALVAGAEDGDRRDNDDAFFRNSAMQVISAWLHAADLANLDMTAVLRWQQNIHLTEPHDILQRHSGAEPAARLALLKHLDERAERTTSSVERFIVLALHPFATRDGQDFAVVEDGADVEQLVRDQVTVYLLASPNTAAAVSPLLTLFADEWIAATRAVALTYPERRLPTPAVALLDELRTLVPIPTLPQVAYEYRKFGLGLIYALQNAHQEVELYGPAAESLAQNVQVTIVGGYDRSIADELTAQSGEAPVPSVGVGGALLDPRYDEGETYRPVVTARDQLNLADGDSLVRVLGASLFYMRTDSFRADRALRRRIAAEEADVRARVAAAAASSRAETEARWTLAQASYDRRMP